MYILVEKNTNEVVYKGNLKLSQQYVMGIDFIDYNLNEDNSFLVDLVARPSYEYKKINEDDAEEIVVVPEYIPPKGPDPFIGRGYVFVNDEFVLNEYGRSIIAKLNEKALQELYSDIVVKTQERLDNFARTRDYDSILSAATYATSSVIKFQQEGQCAVEVRDATWAKLYEILSEVEEGTRATPTSFADIETELPVLAWTN